MTGPASGGSERGTGAPSRSTGTQGAVGAILIVLALGLALRLIIAYLLPGSGFEVDLNAFRFWAANLAHEGLHGFYDRDFFHDYTPGYLYVLWLVGVIGGLIGGIGDLIKVPPILADLAIGYLVWSMIRELGARDRLALVGGAAAVLNPISWFDSVAWGQVDSFGVVFLLLALRSLWRDQPERAAIFTVIAAIIKPQLGILIPLLAVVTIRRALWPTRTQLAPAGRLEPNDLAQRSLTGRLRAWERQTDSAARIVTTGVAGFVTAVVLCFPFGLSVIDLSTQPPFIHSGLVDQVVVAGGGYPYLTVNAYNPWAIVPGNTGSSLASAGLWICDNTGIPADQCTAGTALIAGIPAVLVGGVLLVIAIGLVLWTAARNPNRLTLLVALAVLALAFFVLPTRVHERYGYPFFALGAILFAVSPRWRIAYVVLTIATFANMYVVLTTLYDNPSIDDWFGLGGLIRSQAGVMAIAIAHATAFVWVLLQLRRRASESLEEELELARVPGSSRARVEASVGRDRAAEPWTWPEPEPARIVAPEGRPFDPLVPGARVVAGAAGTGPGTAASAASRAVAMPTWSPPRTFTELGFIGWLRDRLSERPIRPDRTADLRHERGGRLDRLDLWILVVLVAATLCLRTFRLAEPYQMHFDEVYHARTAAEFLQSWRYGLSHDIYEWTHPHLAKYIMAGGIVLWGQDDVSATSQLGAPVRAAVIEARRDDPTTNGRAGERVHVATGEEIRSYDLRTRQLVSTVPAPGASALAIDSTAEQLVVGFADGRIESLDLATLGAEGIARQQIVKVAHPVNHLLVTTDGATILAASDDRLSAIDTATNQVTGTTDLPGIADLANAGSGAAIVTTPSVIADPTAMASKLAAIIGGDPADYEARIAGASPDVQVVLGAPGDSKTRTAVEGAIADGSLSGLEVVDLPRVAVADGSGVTFVDPSTAAVSSTIPIDGGAHGLAMVTGIEDTKIYATAGPATAPVYEIIAVAGDSAKNGPASLGHHPLPGPGTRIAYDDATQQVHVLGRVPATDTGGHEGWTVYVIEPHGIEPQGPAVYADAKLPTTMTPAAWAMDVESQYMTDDREALLVFGSDGATASIPLGSHAFAWRLPGVIAGALMAGLLYLLARILFRRRLVAGLVAAFVLLDGMLFVQSRIGMNDVYVGLFIVAAYTLFAAVWTGWWRSRGAFWLSMPVIGLLLGLALASKWVAAYAIGALALLLLVRSALGRVLAILGLIGATSILGYLALAVPEGQGLGNFAFLIIMIGLTVIAVVAAVLHPIAWSDDEMRAALLGPAALGIAVFFGALALGRLNAAITISKLSFTPLHVALALVLASLVVAGLFKLAGGLGFGPLAIAPGPADPARLLEPPAPAPDGWLRPGWLAGLPVLFAAVCLIAIPLVVYVVSYIPWALIENHQLWEGVPTGHTGQTLLELTGQMYGYHNGLTSAHPASSPWWAWPFDLKPVWFYQDGFAAGTTAAIYDAGNLVIWWLGVPALIFVSIMAFRRRSLPLALIAIGFAAQWVSWARIERAAFQYHYYTALPFVILALAYLVAELWHGPSWRTWLAARLAAAAAIVAPAAMWLLSRPLCAFVRVTTVNPGSQACPATIPDLAITVRSLALLGVVAVGAFVLARVVLALGRSDETDLSADPDTRGALLRLLISAGAVAGGFIVARFLPDTPLFTLSSVPVEPIALVVALPLGYFASTAIAARDARRFAIGVVLGAVAWFVVWYPNISALPLPATVVNAYQGVLPTYLYAFQFPVSTVARNVATPLLSSTLAILGVAVTVTCLVVAYSAWAWRVSLAASAAARTGAGASGEAADGLARGGGDA